MTAYPTLDMVHAAHARVIQAIGGDAAILNESAIVSVLELVQASYFGQDAYPTLAEKAAYLGYALCQNHPYQDGNKRTACLVMLTFIHLNRRRIVATVDEQERVFFAIASGQMRLDQFTAWVRAHLTNT